MENKIYYLNDMPFSLAYGGKEVQLLGYQNLMNTMSMDRPVELLNPWEKFDFEKNSIIHLFGSGKWFHNILLQARQNRNIRKVVVSPTFFYNSPWKLKVGKYLSKLSPFDTQFFYKEFIFDSADVLVVNSRSEGEQIEAIFGSKLSEKIEVIHNTVSDNFSVLGDTECFLREFSIEPGFVLSVGFLDERKNSLRFIESFVEAFPFVNKKLVLIGGERFVDVRNSIKLKNLLGKYSDLIIHIPFLKPGSALIKSAYYNCAFHALVSHVETPGISNLEALSFRKNILVGDCPPVREYFSDIAHYVNPVSRKDIVRGIVEVNTLSNNSRPAISDEQYGKYLHSSILEKLLKIYE